MKNYKLQIPEGVMDYLDKDLMKKEWISNQLKSLFKRFNYQAIETPSFEYLDVFQENQHSFQEKTLYHLTNREGELMALRSDMTRSIARVVSTKKNTYPIRYTYLCNTFRYPERYQGKLHEFTQAGIELIGDDSINADFEVLYLAIHSMMELGLKEFSLHIGSGDFLNQLMTGLNLDQENKERMYERINAFDGVGVKKILKEQNAKNEDLDLFLDLIESVGGISLLQGLKARITNENALKALTHLEELYFMLEKSGLASYILFDFSILSYGNYYTGIRFQGFTKGVGFRVIEGGRYDQLISSFGKSEPAIGFGVYVNYLINIIEDVSEKPLYLIGFNDVTKVLETLNKYKEVQIELGPNELELVKKRAELKKYDRVLFVTKEGEELVK